jgi:sulfite oxidase
MLSKLKGCVRPVVVAAAAAQRGCANCARNAQEKPWPAVGIAAAATLGGTLAFQFKESLAEPRDQKLMKVHDYGFMSKGEMQKLIDNGRIVCAYKGDVYDVTEFSGHPGGVGRLQMAAGGDLEVYWKVYTQHNRGHVVEHVMAPYKIGYVSDDDMKKITSETYYDTSAYTNDPEPYPELLINTRYPCNAEGRLSYLTDSWQTPIGRHFVRNHSAVPLIDEDEHTLTVCGEGCKETVFSVKDLKDPKKFKKHSVTTVIQCNGNRREDYHYYDGETPAFGPPHWVAGAIGNATWSGVRLRDLIAAAGMDVDAICLRTKDAPPLAKQIGLLGADTDEVGNHYCCSFPFEKAIDPFGDCLVAFEMNGEPIPRAHGFPLRCIVPGNAGARNCKFLQHIEVTDDPCKGNSNWKQYAVHAPDVAMRKIAEFEEYKKELKEDPPVQEMPVQSLITSPCPGDIISAIKNGDKSVYVKGIAWGGGGSGINRVDVSLDDGKTFTRARVLPKPIEQRRKSEWSWSFFEKEIPLPDDMRNRLQDGHRVELVLTSKALNSAWNMQPENASPNLNAHGCCVNHWYRVPALLCPNAKEHQHAPEGDFGNKPSGGRFATPFRNWDSPAEADAARERTLRIPPLYMWQQLQAGNWMLGAALRPEPKQAL